MKYFKNIFKFESSLENLDKTLIQNKIKTKNFSKELNKYQDCLSKFFIRKFIKNI